jgi:NAD(P)H-nitrite reductase large subunit
VNYNRIMLSPVLAGEKAFDDIVINTAAWYETTASRWCRAIRWWRSTATARW